MIVRGLVTKMETRRRSEVSSLSWTGRKFFAHQMPGVARAIGSYTQLEELDLTEMSWREKGDKRKGRFPGLYHDGVRGIKIITQNFPPGNLLKILRLGTLMMRDEGVYYLTKVLASLPVLELLDLASNGIGTEGVYSLRSVVYDLKNLQHLNLLNNVIRDVDALGLILTMVNNRKSCEINLKFNRISDREQLLEQLKEWMPDGHEVKLNLNKQIVI
jgi:hypothetical protein